MTADRMNKVEESSTMKMKELASKLKAEGKKVISFTVGEPDFDTPRHIVDAAIEALNAGMTRYINAAGLPELREAIAEKSREENGIPCETANVLVTPTKHAIFESLFATVNPGDEVLVPDPCWVTYFACISMSEGKAVHVPLTEENDFRMTPEALAEKITPKSKVLMINSPSNPCGSVNTEDDLKGIADLAKDHDLTVITDEVYERIVFDGAKHISIGSLPGMFERTITVNGFSKTYAMTGWRLGWLVADKPIFNPILKIQMHTITHAPTFIQKAGVAALKGPTDDLDMMLGEFLKRRDIVYKYIQETPGASAPKPIGAFYAFMKFDADMTDQEMSMHLLKEANVLATPGSAFGENGRGHLRLSFATSTEEVEKGMAGIKIALEKL